MRDTGISLPLPDNTGHAGLSMAAVAAPEAQLDLRPVGDRS
jgi:hypothetical protein